MPSVDISNLDFLKILAVVVLFVAAKVSYELGILEGRSRERKNIIAKKRLEYERPEQVRDRE